ncbi:MAG: HD domain-containing protein [Clostridium sp.]|uniref:HD domain-containing protein n=1 Tax=Clostridium sp. TaxID=1506 RepID=UPI003D6D01E2
MLNIKDYLSSTELLNVLNKYNVVDIRAHSMKVSNCALRLFDSLNPCYEFKDEERTLLYLSSMLHDIGYFINKENHHKHSKYIILKEPLLDILPINIRNNLAIIVSSHGKSMDDDIKLYQDKEKTSVLKLISLLRIADSLDHKHNLNVKLEKVELRNNSLNIQIKGDASCIILKRIKKRSSLFSNTFNIPIYTKCI